MYLDGKKNFEGMELGCFILLDKNVPAFFFISFSFIKNEVNIFLFHLRLEDWIANHNNFH